MSIFYAEITKRPTDLSIGPSNSDIDNHFVTLSEQVAKQDNCGDPPCVGHSKESLQEIKPLKANIFKKKKSPINNKNKPNKKLRPSSLVRVNFASAAKLQTLRGIGPKTAERIIRLRKSRGQILNLKELKEVKGLGNKKLNLIKDHITFN